MSKKKIADNFFEGTLQWKLNFIYIYAYALVLCYYTSYYMDLALMQVRLHSLRCNNDIVIF